MSLSKKALMIGIGSTVAVGGVTTAIAVPLSQQTAVEQQKPTVMPSMITPAAKLEDLVKALKAEDIVVLNKKPAGEAVMRKNSNSTETTTVNKDETYAFNLNETQFDLTDEAKKRFPSQISFKFELNAKNNTSSKLNSGLVSPTVKATFGNEEVANTTVELTNFKKANEQVVKLLTTSENKLVLDLTKAKDTTYKTIETLNQLKDVPAASAEVRREDGEGTVATSTTAKKQSGLTELLHKLTISDQEDGANKIDIKQWDVNGEVKLERIVPNQDKTNTFFYLTKSNNTSYLKLVNGTEEVVVDEISLTNLLATSINVKVNGINDEENKKFVEEFAKNASQNGYKAEDGKISLDIKKSEQVVSTVSVVPSILEKKDKTDEVKANLVVSFGNGINAKTYNLGNEKEDAELKAAEFGFNVYLRRTDKKEKLLKATDITTGSKLEDYFVTKNFSEPFAETQLNMEMMFKKVTVNGSLKDFTLAKADKTERNKVGAQQSDVGEEVPVSENWVSFVTYTYKQTGLKSKLLLTPVLDVIHLEVKQAIAAEEAAAGDGGK